MPPRLDGDSALWIIFAIRCVLAGLNPRQIVKCNVLHTTLISLFCRLMWCSSIGKECTCLCRDFDTVTKLTQLGTSIVDGGSYSA